MRFDIESEGGRLHWVVRCVEKGRVAEVHRFYRSLDKFLYHRGAHGAHEAAALAALSSYLEKNPRATAGLGELEPGENSTMHVRQIAAGGGKRDKKD